MARRSYCSFIRIRSDCAALRLVERPTIWHHLARPQNSFHKPSHKLMKLIFLATTTAAATACSLNAGENQFSVGRRTVRAYVPAAGANKALPAIIDFHGYGGSGRGQASLLNTQAERENFVHVYPDGTGLISGWNGQVSERTQTADRSTCS